MSIYLGETPLANTGYDKANTDLSNLTSTGKNIANWSNNVTNCITEIPQDIKLELNNGTLTLKAGSKVYVPNGFEQDGTTPKFDFLTVPNDLTVSGGNPNWANNFLFIRNSLDALDYKNVSSSLSGTSDPQTISSAFYNTQLNKLYCYTGAGSQSQDSFPLCKFSADSNGVIKSIDQVFNGFGYIGSTVFALPGVKGLIPNGRNADGTLKNIEFTVSNVLTITYTGSWANTWVLQLSSAGIGIVSASNYIESDNEPTNTSGWTVWHNTKDNINYLKNIGAEGASWERQDLCNNVAKFITDSSNKITSFNPKTAFHALGYNDSSTISGWSMPSSRYIELTLGASGATYTAPANGWFGFSSTAGSANAWIYLTNESTPLASFTETSTAGIVARGYVPAKKGQTVSLGWFGGAGISSFVFIYAEGEQ